MKKELDFVKLWAKVEKAKQDEIETNIHLGYAPSHQTGSLSVLVRWDELAALLTLAEDYLKPKIKVQKTQ